MKKILLSCALLLVLLSSEMFGQTATINLRPQYVDISSATSETAVLVTLESYSTDDVKYRLYNGSNQYNCWNPATNTYITSTSYSSAPSAPGTPSTTSTWWILSQRGNNISTTVSYRDRLGPSYGSNFNTVILPTSTAISSPFNLSGKVLAGNGYDLTVKYVVLGFDAENSGNLLCATSTALSTGDYILVCNGGSSIKRIEIRTITNVLVNSITNSGGWSSTTIINDIPLPVDLVSFYSLVRENNVELRWETSWELNNKGFEIWRDDAQVGFVTGLNTASTYSYTDKKLTAGVHRYKLKQIDFNGNHEDYLLNQDVVIQSPKKFQTGNFPNPFNPATTISYKLPTDSRVTITIYDITGRLVTTLLDTEQKADYYEVPFDGTNLSSGAYFYRITAGEYREQKKMLLIK